MNGQLLIITNHIVLDTFLIHLTDRDKNFIRRIHLFFNDFKDGADLIFMDGTMCYREA